MANAHLAYPDLALDNFSGTDPEQDAEAFIRLIECKNNFALGTEPDDADAEHVNYLFRKKSFIFLIAKRTNSRMVWAHHSGCNDLERSSNSVHNQIFR